MTSFTYPETSKYRAAHVASKTRKLPDGRFEAVAAFWFSGRRLNMKFATGDTRYAAERLARKALGA